VNRERRLVGLIQDSVAVEASKKGVSDLSTVMDTDFGSVQPDTVLAELFAPLAESPLPLPVVDDDRKLVGVVPRVTLLQTMAGVATETDTSSSVDVEAEREAERAEIQAGSTDQPGVAS